MANKNNNDKAVKKLLKVLSERQDEMEEEETPNPINNLNSKILKGVIEQYLSPFIIIGYDIKGNCVNMGNVSSQKDYDAISTGLTRFMEVNGIDGGIDDDDDISDFLDMA